MMSPNILSRRYTPAKSVQSSYLKLSGCHYTAQALRARGKRVVALPHAFGLLASVAGWTWCDYHGIGGSGKNCDDNDAQPDASAAATTTATTTMNRKKKGVHAVVLCA